MKSIIFRLFLCSYIFSQFASAQEITGELKKWHKVTLNFNGPTTSEKAENNPFLNYRLNVTFRHDKSGKEYIVPGYFAADSDAANTSADSGNVWKVHFCPDAAGEWKYVTEFVQGKFAALRKYSKLKSAGFMDGKSGSFIIKESDKIGNDFRSKGRLQYVGERYLKFAETGEYFLKCGPDAPENFLAYYAFDGNFQNDGHKDNLVKTWAAHEKDWKQGDPTWKDGKGKEIIGAMNYLASKGLNSVSFLTMNIEGDDQNVFPYVDYNTRDRFDCSKLDQWEILFEHADKIGLFLHFKTMESENQGLLDNGGVGLNTKLYYRELIARFGHHLALNWNLCEESGDWDESAVTFPYFDEQRLTLAKTISELDPADRHIVIHNGVWFDGIYGANSKFTGASLQTALEDFSDVHSMVSRILMESEKAGKIWAVACDESGNYQHGLILDNEDPEHNNARKNGLWGAFMAGGWGTEYYFGYKHPQSDLNCQDYRSRDLFWDQCKYALEFFKTNKIPFWKMVSSDNLISNPGDYCLAHQGEIYLVYLKNGGTTELNLNEYNGEYEILWFNPRKGGQAESGNKKIIEGNGKQKIGEPPYDKQLDWVVIVKKSSAVAQNASLPNYRWTTIETTGDVTGRHENAFIEYHDQFYLIGGRGINPVNVFDPKTNKWETLKNTPLELHHFQAVVYNDAIYIVGAMTGPYPKEKPVENIWIYYPQKDKWVKDAAIPVGRLRGSAGVVVYNDKIYLVGGIEYGHTSGTNNDFDSYDLKTKKWEILTKAPNIRDHFSAIVVNDKLFCIGGRNTSIHHEGNFESFFNATIPFVDVYDFKSGSWKTLKNKIPFPTAAGGIVNVNNTILYMGGEGQLKQAYNQTQCLDMTTGEWTQLAALNTGRHGSGEILYDNDIYFAAGSPNQGGGNMNSIERFSLGHNWQSLFNGQDLSGWEVKCTKADKDKNLWTADNGSILCNSIGSKTHNYVWLQTKEEFDNFELRLKFQVSRANKGNSGVQFRSRYDENAVVLNDVAGWLDGPQVDIDPENPWRNGLIYDETREVKRWINPSLPDWKISESDFSPKKAIYYFEDEGTGWNDMTIICNGMHIKTIVNNVVVSEYDATGILDDEAHTRHNVGVKGYIALQLHQYSENLMRFKDIEIRHL